MCNTKENAANTSSSKTASSETNHFELLILFLSMLQGYNHFPSNKEYSSIHVSPLYFSHENRLIYVYKLQSAIMGVARQGLQY